MAAGVKSSPWYMLAVAGIGMVSNVVIAGAPRSPEAFGIPLDWEHTIVGGRGDFVGGQVMRVLRDIENKYPQVGRCLLNTYFPGLTMEDDIKFWEAAAAKAKQNQVTKDVVEQKPVTDKREVSR